MSTIQTNYPIGDLFTWKVQTTAKYFAEVRSLDDLRTVCSSDEFKSSAQHYVLGRGANTLFATRHYDGFVIQMGILGLTQVHEDADSITFRIGAGQDWHGTIEALIQHYGVGGMENLAYIPGTFGAAPIQNVGAYGQTFEDVFVELEAYHTKKQEIEIFGNNHAYFEYRGSYFKSREFLDTHIIVSVSVRLEKPHVHALNTSYHSNYESLKSELQGEGPFTPLEIFDAVTRLRKKKLPEIAEVGTNGSTFINPLISGAKLKELLVTFPQLQYYPAQKMQYVDRAKLVINDTEAYKIAAGHIFDELGWKGKVVDGVGTWRNHALVVCNYSATSPEPIIAYISAMQQDFQRATGILIHPEINIIH